MSRRPRVLIAGAFGQGNPGDESVLHAFVSGLDGCDLAATVGHRLADHPAPGDPPGDRVYRPIPSGNRAAVARAVASADLTVVTATVLKALHPSCARPAMGLLANTALMAWAARVLGRPVAMIGAGAGDLPGRTAGVLTRATMAAAGPVELRDEESAEALRQVGVKRELPVGADVVWAALPPRRITPLRAGRKPKQPVAVVALSHLAGGSEMVAALRATAAALVAEGYEVALQPWQAPQDLSMAAAVAAGAGVPLRIRDRPAHVAEASAGFEDVSLVVGLRFHSLVAAGAAGVPFVAVAHEPKLAGLARRLGQEAVVPSACPDQLPAAALRAVSGPPPPRRLIEHERNLAESALARTRALAFARAAAGGRLRAAKHQETAASLPGAGMV